MRLSLTQYAFLLIFLAKFSTNQAIQSDESTKIKVYRSVENEGFHRFLTTEILYYNFYNDDIDNFPALANRNCSLMLVENFETNVYVDNYELKAKNYDRMFTFLLSNRVNTETAAYKSRNFNLFLFINRNIVKCYSQKNDSDFLEIVNNQTSFNISDEEQADHAQLKTFCRIFIRIPIHVRYNEPVSSGDFIDFTLKSPHIYAANCTNDNNNAVRQEQFSSDYKLQNVDFHMLINSSTFTDNLVFPCQKSSNREKESNKLILQRTYDFLTKTYFRSNVNDDYSAEDIEQMCVWNSVSFHYLNDNNLIKITIPIGNFNHELLVLIITFMVVTAVLFSMAKCILKFSNSYNKIDNNGEKL